jgi:rare lipoprotein A
MAVPRILPAVIALAVLMTACGTSGEHRTLIPLPWPHRPAANHPKVNPELPVQPPAGSGRGGYYEGDGPGDNPPPNLRDIPDAEVKLEPYSRYGNRPYSVFGQTYTPLLGSEPLVQRGMASWYGRKFHGQRTSSGELYDMYKMTAAHPTLPIPSYARITSLESGKQVVVRINDRGPFHSNRIVDVSYTAALKLGLLGKGSHQVELERVLPNDRSNIATVRRMAASEAAAAPAPRQIASLMLEDRLEQDSAAVAGSAPAAAAPKAGFYLQLGAYTRDGKAEEVGAQLAQYGIAQETLEVVQAGAVKRLYSGPFETRAKAQQAARALPAELGLKPLVVKR